MAEMPKIEVHVAGQDVNFRTGSALTPREPRTIVINGTIDAPFQYIKDRLKEYDPKASVVLVDTNKGEITLQLAETNYYGPIIKGQLTIHPDLAELKINQEHLFTPKDLIRLLKRFKFYFKEPGEHRTFIESLSNFTADVNTKIKAAKDQKGNSIASVERTVANSVSIPRFVLDIPIFKGVPRSVFGVEIWVDATDADLSYYLESIDLFQLQQTEKELYLTNRAKEFKEAGYSVVYLS